MALDVRYKMPRGTRANLDTLAAANGLLAGEPYLITDENRLAIALTTSTYEDYAKESEAGGGGGGDTTYWIVQSAARTLTSTTNEQKFFDTIANGRLTLPTGRYFFDWMAYMSGMSATSGNAKFSPLGTGTAVTDEWAQDSYGIDNNTPGGVLALSGGGSLTDDTANSVATGTTGTGLRARMSGMFQVTTAGTIIPSIALATATAATVTANSWFKITKIGNLADDYVGPWD